MSTTALRRVFLLSCVLIASSALAQEANPAKGVWVGHWGPDLTPESRIVIVMDYDGREITGVLNPGPHAAPLKVARMDITPGRPESEDSPAIMPVFKMYIEADTEDANGNAVTIVADGTMQNVPVANRRLVGSWSQTTNGNTVSHDFILTRQYP